MADSLPDSVKEFSVRTPSAYRYKPRGFALPNGSKVIVVTDPTTTKAAAAMSIRVGSHFDLPELPGLAHLCEHMLFLGTERNPREGEYNSFVSQHGGHSNAWTEDATTQYYFEVSTDAFEEGLQIFLPFFTKPLFTASSLEREVKAVHSEDEKNHSNDYWCKQEVLKLHMANPEHPYRRYGNGNQKTLWTDPLAAGVDIRGRLLDFFNQHYVAENACLAVVSPLAAEKVIQQVTPVLMEMRRGRVTVDSFPVVPFDVEWMKKPENPGQWICIQSNKAVQNITVDFPIPFALNHSDSKPAGYASHIIGHECDSSLCGVLKSAGLATSLSAGAGWGIDHNNDLFTVSISLTAQGVARLDEVLNLIFQAIAHLRETIGVKAELVEDHHKSLEQSFNLSEPPAPSSLASSLCKGGNIHGLEKALSGSSLPDRHDETLSWKVLDYLRPENALFILSLQDYEGAVAQTLPKEKFPLCAVKPTQKTLHHGAMFNTAHISAEQIAAWSRPASIDPRFGAPKVNPFLVSSFNTLPLSKDETCHRFDREHGTWYYKADTRFEVPNAAFVLALESPQAYASPRNRFMTRVAASVVDFLLTEHLYYASLAASHAHVGAASRGFEMSVSGPSEKLWTVGETILKTIFSLDKLATEAAFNTYCEKTRRGLRSMRMSQPYQLGSERMNKWVHTVRYDYEDILAASGGDEGKDNTAVSFNEFVVFVKDVLLSSLRYEAMFAGNITQEQSLMYVEAIEKHLSLPSCSRDQMTKEKEVRLPPTRQELLKRGGVDGSTLVGTLLGMRCPNMKDKNWSCQLSVFVGLKAPRQRVLSDCLMAYLKSPFFDTLRTAETLGYIVSAGSGTLNNCQTLNFFVQSAEQSSNYLLSRIYAFILAIPEQLCDSKLTEEKFKTIVEAQIAVRVNPPKSVSAEVNDLWARKEHPFGFGARAEEVAILRNDITREDLRKFAAEQLDLTAPDARIMVSMVTAGEASEDSSPAASVAGWNVGSDTHKSFNVIEVPAKVKQDAERSDKAEEEKNANEDDDAWVLPSFQDLEAQPQLTVYTPHSMVEFRKDAPIVQVSHKL